MSEKKLNAQDLTDACIWLARQKGMGELAETAHDLHCRIKVFEALTWFPFLQKQVSDCAGRGMRGKVGRKATRTGVRYTLSSRPGITKWTAPIVPGTRLDRTLGRARR